MTCGGDRGNLSPSAEWPRTIQRKVMIAHPESTTYASFAQRLLIAFDRMLANRHALRDLRAAQLEDCGITKEMLERAVDWRFWRRVNEPAPWVRTSAHASTRMSPLASVRTAA